MMMMIIITHVDKKMCVAVNKLFSKFFYLLNPILTTTQICFLI
jgi:hypothetical protein